jgi:hypothetical protein
VQAILYYLLKIIKKPGLNPLPAELQKKKGTPIGIPRNSRISELVLVPSPFLFETGIYIFPDF